MAESIVQVSEGVGKKLHTFNRTIGANSVEDEVTLLGENYLASYTVQTGPISTATAASHILQIMAGAALKVRIRQVVLWQQAGVTAAVLADFRLHRLTSAGTGGGALNAAAMDPADAASGVTAMTLPTVKGAEGTLMALANPYMIQTVPASLASFGQLVVWDFDRPRSKPLIIAAGVANGLAIKNTLAIAAGQVTCYVLLDESNF
jgi:hypothetical protein